MHLNFEDSVYNDQHLALVEDNVDNIYCSHDINVVKWGSRYSHTSVVDHCRQLNSLDPLNRSIILPALVVNSNTDNNNLHYVTNTCNISCWNTASKMAFCVCLYNETGQGNYSVHSNGILHQVYVLRINSFLTFDTYLYVHPAVDDNISGFYFWDVTVGNIFSIIDLPSGTLHVEQHYVIKIFSCLTFGNNIDKHTAVTDFNSELKTYRKYGVSYTQF